MFKLYCVMTCLAGGQTPRLAKHFFEEWRLYVEVLWNNVESEQMTVDAAACHCITITVLVCFACSLQQQDFFRLLHTASGHKNLWKTSVNWNTKTHLGHWLCNLGKGLKIWNTLRHPNSLAYSFLNYSTPCWERQKLFIFLLDNLHILVMHPLSPASSLSHFASYMPKPHSLLPTTTVPFSGLTPSMPSFLHLHYGWFGCFNLSMSPIVY